MAAYTFDAGPNAVVYYLEPDRDVVLGAFKGVTDGKEGWGGERGRAVEVVEGWIDEGLGETLRRGVSRVILTGVGEGPISVQEHLVDEKGDAVVQEKKA